MNSFSPPSSGPGFGILVWMVVGLGIVLFLLSMPVFRRSVTDHTKQVKGHFYGEVPEEEVLPEVSDEDKTAVESASKDPQDALGFDLSIFTSRFNQPVIPELEASSDEPKALPSPNFSPWDTTLGKGASIDPLSQGALSPGVETSEK